MSDVDERDLRRALGERSGATFDDLRRRLAGDRPGPCAALAAAMTSLATGGDEPEASRHAEECARCRDALDATRDLWRRLRWPASQARFDALGPRLFAPAPFRAGRAVAAALLAVTALWAAVRPPDSPAPGGQALAGRMSRAGMSLREIARVDSDLAVHTLIDIGGPEAEALLIGLMGRDPERDALIADALAGESIGPLHPADLVREWRPDLFPALMDAAPPGSASTIVPALFDPRYQDRAAAALARLPRDEVDAALELAALGATPEEAEVFAERGIAVAGALAAAVRSGDHRNHCFWGAVTVDGGLQFLLAAAGVSALREDALMFIDLLPDDAVAAACRKALVDPMLAAGAARAAGRLKDRRLVPDLMRAARHPPRGMGLAGFEVSGGGMVTVQSLSFEAMCLQAVSQITSDKGTLEPH